VWSIREASFSPCLTCRAFCGLLSPGKRKRISCKTGNAPHHMLTPRDGGRSDRKHCLYGIWRCALRVIMDAQGGGMYI
jgi:hypothetical protein